jgi:hypothetical protein
MPSTEYVTYADLSDDERPYPTKMNEEGGWESDSDTEYLVRCCDEDRPPNRENIPTLVVKPSAGNEFVTVHDYVTGKPRLLHLATFLIIISAVHPWLISEREDILTAMRVVLFYPTSLPTELMVRYLPDHLMFTEKSRWIQRMRGSSYVRTVPVG